MTATAYIGELFPDLPTSEKEKSEESNFAQFKRFLRTCDEEGGLVTRSQAAILLQCSKQAIHIYISSGTLKTFEFFGIKYLSAREVEARFDRMVENGKAGKYKTLSSLACAAAANEIPEKKF